MSRSYKKHPIIKYGGFINKRLANHRVRQYMKRFDDEGALPKSFSKRIVETWDINDIKDRMSKEEAINFWKKTYNNNWWFREKYPTVEDYLKDWEEWYRRK